VKSKCYERMTAKVEKPKQEKPVAKKSQK